MVSFPLHAVDILYHVVFIKLVGEVFRSLSLVITGSQDMGMTDAGTDQKLQAWQVTLSGCVVS